MSPGPGPYQLGTVASILKVSRPVVMKLIREGQLPVQRSASGLRVEMEALRDWVEEQSRRAQGEAGGLAKMGGNS
jgi:excisionase family DNA binding protein